MKETYTIEIDERRFKVLNTMMNASDPIPQFEMVIEMHGNVSVKEALWDEISDKAHGMNMCKDPNCKKVQPKDIEKL